MTAMLKQIFQCRVRVLTLVSEISIFWHRYRPSLQYVLCCGVTVHSSYVYFLDDTCTIGWTVSLKNDRARYYTKSAGMQNAS